MTCVSFSRSILLSSLAGVAFMAHPVAAQKPKPAPAIRPAPPAVTQLPAVQKLPPGTVSIRVPISGGAPPLGDPGRVLHPPPPVDTGVQAPPAPPAARAAPVAGARPETVHRPAEFSLTAQRPYVPNAGWIRLGEVLGYHADSPGDFNGGQGWVALDVPAVVEVSFYTEAGKRTLLDFSFERRWPATYVIRTAAGEQEQTFDQGAHHLVLATQPAERSGWAIVAVRARPDSAPPDAIVPLAGLAGGLAEIQAYGWWTFYDVTITTLP